MATATSESSTNRIKELVGNYLKSPGSILDLSALDLNIVVAGRYWGGVVDSSVAAFVTSIDRAVRGAIYNAGVDAEFGPKGIIALRIRDGSFHGKFEYSKEALEILRKLKPFQEILVLSGALQALGLLRAADIVEALESDDYRQQIRPEEKEKLVRSLAEMEMRQEDVIRSLVQLFGKDELGDTVTLPGSTIPQSAVKEVQRVLAAPPRDLQPIYIDGIYQIRHYGVSIDGMWTVTLSDLISGVTFPAEITVAGPDFEEFNNLCSNWRTETIKLNLQVSAQLARNEKWCLYFAKVIKVGPPRPGSIMVTTAVSGVLDSTPNLPPSEKKKKRKWW